MTDHTGANEGQPLPIGTGGAFSPSRVFCHAVTVLSPGSTADIGTRPRTKPEGRQGGNPKKETGLPAFQNLYHAPQVLSAFGVKLPSPPSDDTFSKKETPSKGNGTLPAGQRVKGRIGEFVVTHIAHNLAGSLEDQSNDFRYPNTLLQTSESIAAQL